MSIKVNCNGENEHKFNQVCAFIDDEHDFYLVDEEGKHIVHLTNKGCTVYDCDSYESVEFFLDVEFCCKALRIFSTGEEYEIIVNG